MNPEPLLLIIAPIADGGDWQDLLQSKAAGEQISINSAKFDQLEMLEIIVDGMPFLLSRSTASETRQRCAPERFERLFADLPSPNDSAIGIAPGDILSNAMHLPEINRRMLMLGKWIGINLNATSAAWVPSSTLSGFSYFVETVSEYLAGGPLPILFQIAFSEVGNGYFETRGLDYFSGQEIRLSAPPDYSVSGVAKRMVRIIDDIASHGKIEVPSQARGMIAGEILIFSPSDDHARVDITIENRSDKSHQVPT
ncbi:hypothetical protein [Parasphingorhabdus sp.]|uniref:hypothetical protein n=1 Tax=Parasphingorhabdus sp. TaxID=2709688 RepID=UPI003A8E177C